MHAGALTLPSYPDLFVWANVGRAVMPLAAVESDATVISCSALSPARASDIGDNDLDRLAASLDDLASCCFEPGADKVRTIAACSSEQGSPIVRSLTPHNDRVDSAFLPTERLVELR